MLGLLLWCLVGGSWPRPVPPGRGTFDEFPGESILGTDASGQTARGVSVSGLA